ncbi:putative transcriptional regulatory protein [Hibiscus syriacus]|uniref:Transcriptional regulatory protein n=1 Tax=Hibiscus syriacus TaxID=106335 RepID=A0A6A3C304_HIBSY|nr:putative transcriptional regulatory protein [Hibiscus syriacus]
MSRLGDDELSLVLKWVYDQNDRKSFSQVCKQWLRVEGLSRLSLRIFISDPHLEFVAKTCPRLRVLNLNLRKALEEFDEVDGISGFEDVGNDGVSALANGCRNLTKALLRKRRNVGNIAVISLVSFCKNLTSLDLGRCNLVDDQAVEAIGCSNSIRVLNLEACSLITDHGLAVLATGFISRSLKKLVLAECDRITDSGVSMLKHMCCLEELNLAECGPKITYSGGLAVSSLLSLKKLNLAWLINLSDVTVNAIAKHCVNLVAIDLTGFTEGHCTRQRTQNVDSNGNASAYQHVLSIAPALNDNTRVLEKAFCRIEFVSNQGKVLMLFKIVGGGSWRHHSMEKQK